MTDFAQLFHDVAFERDFARLRGDSFQNLFSSIMEKRYPGDFVRVKPWGSIGDRKNDGFLASSQTVYQCYAPNEPSASETVGKIYTDFAGAKTHWPQMKRWTFVHNAWDGVSAPVLAALLALKADNPSVEVDSIGRQELLNEVRLLSPQDRVLLLGAVPDVQTFASLGFSDLQPVVEEIEKHSLLDESGVAAVPPGKVSHNRLGADVERVLQLGMRRYDLVERFFAANPDPDLGDRVGRALTTQYRLLRGQGIPADMIFFNLQAFGFGELRSDSAARSSGPSSVGVFL